MRFARFSLLFSGSIAIAFAALVTAQQAPPKPAGADAASSAGDPVKVAPEVYKLKLDNDRVRVLEVTLPGGGRSPMHAHPEYVVYGLNDGKVRFTSPDGTAAEFEIKQGESVFRPAESHATENIGGTEMRVVCIELKPATAGLAARDSNGQAVPAAAHLHEHLVVTPEQQKFAAGPPGLPPGAEMVLLEGDPAKPGPFAIRAKLPANYTIPPHTHPGDEHVTVLSGTLHMGSGDRVDKSKAAALPAGSYTVMPAKMQHFAYADEPVTIQLHGIGPWGITYVNPADDPRRK